MIPSDPQLDAISFQVYQRGLVIDSQLAVEVFADGESVSKGIGD